MEVKLPSMGLKVWHRVDDLRLSLFIECRLVKMVRLPLQLVATNLMEVLRQAVRQHSCRFERLRQI